MKVECPSCQTTYNLPDDKVGPEGSNVRCGVCRHVFHVDPPTPDDFPGFGESGMAPGWPMDADEDGGRAAADFADHLDAERKKDRFDDASVSSSDFASIDFGKTKYKSEQGSKARTLVLGALVGLLALTGIAGTAAYFFEFWPFAKKAAAPLMDSAAQVETPPAKDAAKQPPQDFKDSLAFDGWRFDFVENEKMGSPGKPMKLLVIEGKVVNRSPATVGQVSITATLLDAKDVPVVNKVFLAGTKATYHELRNFSREDLENKLTSKTEMATFNYAVKPGDEIPFMVVFYDPPQNLKNFSLRINDYMQVDTSQAGQQSAPKK